MALEQLRKLKPAELRASWDLHGFFDRVFIISLPKHTERRRRLAAMLKPHGVTSIEFVDAVDGSATMRENPQRWERRLYTDEIDPLPSPAGAIGCFLSHFAVHCRARKLRLQTYLVLEDDALLLPHGGKRFRQAMAQLPNDWEAIYLDYNKVFSAAKDCTPSNSSCSCGGHAHSALCRAQSGLLHTHAIGYHRRALEWLLPLLSRVEEGAGTRLMPVDLELRAYIERHASSSVHAVLKSPIVAQNRTIASDIYIKGMYG